MGFIHRVPLCTEFTLVALALSVSPAQPTPLLDQGTPAAQREPVRGRTFAVTAAGLSKRALQARLDQTAGVLDALVQGEAVRVVMETDAPPDLAAMLPEAHEARVVPVPPRFEDAFVALLKTQTAHPDTPRTPAAPVPLAAAKSDQAVIEVHGLERRFGSFYAVRDVSFSVAQGEVFGGEGEIHKDPFMVTGDM